VCNTCHRGGVLGYFASPAELIWRLFQAGIIKRALSSPLSAPPRASAPGFLPLSLALAIFRSWLETPRRYPSALPFIEYLARCQHPVTTPVQSSFLHSETSSHLHELLSVLRSLLRRTERIEPPAVRSCGGGYLRELRPRLRCRGGRRLRHTARPLFSL
jgi:hypothetical protein